MCSQEIHDPRSKFKSLGKTLTLHDPDVGIVKGFFKKIRNIFKGVGKKMVQWFPSVYTALGKHPGSVPSTHMVAHNHTQIPVPGDPPHTSDLLDHQAHLCCSNIHPGLGEPQTHYK